MSVTGSISPLPFRTLGCSRMRYTPVFPAVPTETPQRNLYICVDRANAIKLPEGRYFISDIIGCAVTDTEGKQYGKLTDVLETGANDVYVIKGDKTLMVPALKKLLSSVDIQAKAIVLDAAVLEEVGLFED